MSRRLIALLLMFILSATLAHAQNGIRSTQLRRIRVINDSRRPVSFSIWNDSGQPLVTR